MQINVATQHNTVHSTQVPISTVKTVMESSGAAANRLLSQPIIVPSSTAPPTLLDQLTTLSHRVANFYKRAETFGEALAAQQQIDRQRGVGVLEGASAFGSSVSEYLNELVRRVPATQLSAGETSPVDQLGQLSQIYLMGELEQQAFDSILSGLGIDPASLSISDIAEHAYSYLAGSSQSSISAGLSAEGLVTEAGELGGSVNAALGAVGAAYSAYGVVKNWGSRDPVGGAVNGASVGAYIGSQICPGLGTAVGGAIGAVVGCAVGFIKTGKHKDQIARDFVRKELQKNGVLDKNWCLTLADGSKYDIGRDGGQRFKNLDGGVRPAYNTDPSNPLTANAIALVNPLAHLVCGGDQKLSTDFAGYFCNAILSNAASLEEARSNAAALMNSMGLDSSRAQDGLGALRDKGKISLEEFQIFSHDVATLTE